MYYDDEDEKPFIFLSKHQQETQVNIEITYLLKEVTRHLATIVDLRELVDLERTYRSICYDIESREDNIKSVARMANEYLEEGIEDFAETNAYLKELIRDPELASLSRDRYFKEGHLSKLKKKLKKDSFTEDDNHLVEKEIDALFAILSANFEKVTKLRRFLYLLTETESLRSLMSGYEYNIDEAKEALENCQDKNEIEKLQLEYNKWKAFYEPLLEELKPQYDIVYREFVQLRDTLYSSEGASDYDF